MNHPKIHIVSFAIPYPPDYGGIIDVFYKIKSLWENDVEIILHCFEYERNPNEELLKFCKKVYYYPRNKSLVDFFSFKPFIVKSRTSRALLNNLLKDTHPVLLEGIHSSFYLSKLLKNKRKVILRTHNIEYKYYRALAKREIHFFRWSYYFVESIKLKYYEKKQVVKNIFIAAISPSDYLHFQSINPNTIYLPAFHSNEQLMTKPGKGNFILFHGNLSVNENITAAGYILKNICPKVDYSFIFAGKKPPQRLINKVKKHKNAQLIINPSEEKIKELIRDAHIHLLITFQHTGIKLKLINALFGGRFCLTNHTMINNTHLESLVYSAETPDEFVSIITQLMTQTFSDNLLNKREQLLLKIVNNNLNVQKLIPLLD
ncbi:MAG: glycosyltransferase [Bacteroidales bacterium]